LFHGGAPAEPVWKADRYFAFGQGFNPALSALGSIMALPSASQLI